MKEKEGKRGKKNRNHVKTRLGAYGDGAGREGELLGKEAGMGTLEIGDGDAAVTPRDGISSLGPLFAFRARL